MNKCVLIHYSFDWRMIPLAAWASTGVSTEDLELIPVESRLDYIFDSIQSKKAHTAEGLVDFLASEGHTSPFRHITMTFLITSDIATHIQILKHRVGVEVNSESARYKRLKDEYYVPDDLPEEVQTKIREHNERCHSLYQELYQTLIDAGYSKARAKESSRFVLPYSKQISYVVTLSLQAIAHFYQLRSKPEAQLEIRQIAESMLNQIKSTGKFDPAIPFIKGETNA